MRELTSKQLSHQINYVKNLSRRDKDIILNFSGSDMYIDVIKAFLRSGDKHYLKQLIKMKKGRNIFDDAIRFNKIIVDAPKVNTSFWVYRFLQNRFYPTRDGMFREEAFASTTLDLEGLIRMGWDTPYLHRILVPSGAPFLYIAPISQFPEEEEVILPLGSTFVEIPHRGGKGKTFQYIPCPHCQNCVEGYSCIDRLTQQYIDLVLSQGMGPSREEIVRIKGMIVPLPNLIKNAIGRPKFAKAFHTQIESILARVDKMQGLPLLKELLSPNDYSYIKEHFS